MNKSLRRRIEYALVCRFHWFEGGFRLNMEFIKWKLKYYWNAISALWSKENNWLGILIIPVYLIALALELCYMPFDIVKTVFITSLFKSQEQYLYEYKRKKVWYSRYARLR